MVRSGLAEVDAIDRRRVTVLLYCSGLLRLYGLAALFSAGIDIVLAVMPTLSSQILALCMRQILAHFSAGQARIESCIGCNEFGLLGESGTGSGKHGNSGDQFFDVHDALQKWVSDSGFGAQGWVLPVGSCLAESHWFVCVLIDEAQSTHSP